jgi:ankyrin repeat protein
MAALLLAHHADVNPSADGETALLNAAEKGSPELVELLLANGANINVKSKEGLTPLMLAKSNFDKDVSDVLMRHGERE